MRTVLLFCSICAIAVSAFCADFAASTTNTLNFFVVSEQPITGGRHVDTAELPKLGYIKTAPSLVVTGLQSVVTNTAHKISQYAGKTMETFEPALTITMFPADAKRFADLTRQNVGSQILLMLGDRPLIAPFVQMPIETPSLQLTLGKHKDKDRITEDLKRLVRHE